MSTTATVTLSQTEEQPVLIPSSIVFRPLPVPLQESTTNLPNKFMRADQDGYPCRKCLQNAKEGDEMELLSYDPFFGDSTYRCASPIFVHANPKCELATFAKDGSDLVPEQQSKRLMSVRAYDNKHAMMGADAVQGTELPKRAEEFFADENIEYLHVHYAMHGCFALRIDRNSGAQ